jgi:hypothetical protein
VFAPGSDSPKPAPRIAGGLAGAAAAMALLAGCGARERPAASMALAVEVASDTASVRALRVVPPADLHVWVRRVTPTRPAAIEPPLPSAAPDTLAVEPPAPPPLEIDPGLKPPLLRTAARLVRPADSRARAAVELDVRVSETGEVTDALWAAGAGDTALVGAARACALRMRFYPALKGGRPVAVWCRQRFDFGARGE